MQKILKGVLFFIFMASNLSWAESHFNLSKVVQPGAEVVLNDARQDSIASVFAALRNAVESDYRMQAARSTYFSKQIEADGAYSAYLPVVRGTGDLGFSKNHSSFTVDGVKRVYSLNLNQAIPVFGRESARVEVAGIEVEVEAAEVSRVEQDILAEVLQSLLNAESAKKSLVLQQYAQANLAKQVEAVREAVAGGGMRATEVHLVALRLAQVEARQEQAVAELAIAQEKLTPFPPELKPESITKQTLQSWWRGPLTLEALQSAAMQNAPAIIKAQAEAKQASAQYVLARSELWPKANIVLQAQRGSVGSTPADSDSASIELEIPIYEGGASTARIDSAAYRETAAKHSLAYSIRMVSQRVADAWVRWQAARKTVWIWSESEQQEAIFVQLVKEQLAGGGATRIALLQARQSQLETSLQGLAYHLNSDIAWVALMREVGMLLLSNTAN